MWYDARMASTGKNPVEARLLSEFLAMRFPDVRTLQRVRVGDLHPTLDYPDLTDEERRMAGVWRRWVDGIVFQPTGIILIEAAVNPDPGDVSQLELYMHLFPMTPEFIEYRDSPLSGLLVYATSDPVIERLAAARGFRVAYYRPVWVDAYFMTLAARHTRAPLTSM